MIHLDEDTSDALAEAFNLALGEAAASFAEIVQEEIVMTVPVVELLPRTELVLIGTRAGLDETHITRTLEACAGD